MAKIKVIGGGLAGCEACYQLLKRGHQVDLYEMRGTKSTPCHSTNNLAELVCSNSFKSINLDTGSGMLKQELQILGSMLLQMAYQSKTPAGGALAVDRLIFSQKVHQELAKFEGFNLIREEVVDIDLSTPTIIASGPLTSDALSDSIAKLLGKDYLYFFDAVAPIVSGDSIDMSKAFFGARYNKGDDDYLNCPMTKDEYLNFYNNLVSAQRVKLKDFELNVFEGCMPIEVMASRGEDTMRYGPLRPVGIVNPYNNSKPYAVVQLRKENVQASMYNIVGFQTNLTFGEQKRVFSMITGLENAEFVRYGVMHRNTFINSPQLLRNSFALLDNNMIYFAGQITGVEGYVESIASGLISAINLDRSLNGKESYVLPPTTIIGRLQSHISSPTDNYQPMNANFGILPPLDNPLRDKKQRKMQYSQRGIEDLKKYLKLI